MQVNDFEGPSLLEYLKTHLQIKINHAQWESSGLTTHSVNVTLILDNTVISVDGTTWAEPLKE